MKRYLKHIQIERFGGLENRSIGPFSPGLNVVFGPNEAGKSTLSALVRGVLFGWEDALGIRNTYRPPVGDRRAALTFESSEPDVSGHRELVLARDEEGACGDGTSVVDVDLSTFDAVFTFSADELRSFRNSSNVTARLLTAASGTETSPSAAFVEIERRIAEKTSEIRGLSEKIEHQQERVKRAAEQAELYKQEDRELRELREGRSAAVRRIDEVNTDIENLVAWRSELASCDARKGELQAEIEKLTAEREAMASRPQRGCAIDARLLALDSTADRVLRDRLDEYGEARDKAERMLDAAKENSATSTAAYEALLEVDAEDAPVRTHALSPRLLVLLLLTIVFVAAGVPLFIHGREITSLSFTALGLGLVACAVLMAAAAIGVMLRPTRSEAELESRRKDAQWVMLQDRKKLDASSTEISELDDEINRFFEDSGLAAAGGSIRQARSLLDEARDLRSASAAEEQRMTALELRLRSSRQQLDEIEATQVRIELESDLANRVYALEDKPAAIDASSAQPGATGAIGSPGVRRFDVLIRRRSNDRDELMASADAMSQRIGALTRELEHARRESGFPLEKLRYEQLRACRHDAKRDLVELLLAKRIVERAIAAWENESQPEVYARAGELLNVITNGAWVGVATSQTGSLVALGADGVERDPRHLSLGTCQQLYLALRMALLSTAIDVGCAIPVLADDILVNFDAERRAGAARALAQLAEQRQVIVFTCHASTLKALQGAHVIELA